MKKSCLSETEIALRAASKENGERIKAMLLGDVIEFELPDNIYMRRETYRRISGKCYQHLGAGNYQLQAKGNKVVVTRATGRRKQARQMFHAR